MDLIWWVLLAILLVLLILFLLWWFFIRDKLSTTSPSAPSTPATTTTTTPTSTTTITTPPPPEASTKNTPTKTSSQMMPTDNKANALSYANFVKSNVTPPIGNLQHGFPLSYKVDPDYYSNLMMSPAEVGAMSSKDRYDSITEIILQTSAIDIYDAAVRLIALGLMDQLGDSDGLAYGEDWLDFLMKNQIFPGDTTAGPLMTDDTWTYGETAKTVDDMQGFGFIPRLLGQHYANVVDDAYCCVENNTYNVGDNELLQGSACVDCSSIPVAVSTLVWNWNEWRPVTGENAWALLIGPLQYEFLTDSEALTKSSKGLTFALDHLNVFAAMQFTDAGTPLGVYYAPKAINVTDCSDPSVQDFDPCFNISVENNASTLAGLKLLTQFSHVSSAQQTTIKKLIDGITTFLVSHAIVSSFAYDGGQTGSPAVISGFTKPFGSDMQAQDTMAVDVFTWTMSVIPGEIDAKNGSGTCFDLWQTCRQIGGTFDANKNLIGVGYTDNTTAQVLSGEWTYGAIGCCRKLSSFYSGDLVKKESLDADIDSMRTGVMNHLSANVTSGVCAVYYADRRFQIPFGWVANRNFSLASTGWAMYDQLDFSPFEFSTASGI